MLENAENGQPKHPSESHFNREPEWFPIAVASLQPAVTTPELVRLLGSRAPYETVKGWRRGLRGAPQWACDRLATILKAQARAKLELAAQARPGIGSSGKWGTLALHNYRRQRALEKEKASD